MTNTEIPSNPEPDIEEEEPQEQLEKQSVSERLRPWQFQPGKSGNPGGRPKGAKSLKTYVQEMLRDMPDDEKLEYLRGLPKDKIWEMGEGKAKQDVEMSGKLSISNVLNELENGGHETPIEGLENPAPIQDQEQATTVSEVQAEPSADPLQRAQVVSEPHPEIPPVGVHN